MGSNFSINKFQNQKKWENAPKQPILAMFWCISVAKSVSPEFCHSCKVIFCSFFEDEDGWEAEKSWISVKSGFLCQKCCFFAKSQSFWGGKCARNQTLDIKWIKIALEYCNLAIISSLQRNTSNIQCKIWNCPPHPLF